VSLSINTPLHHITIAVTDRYTTFLWVSLSINTPPHHITIAVTDR
jgi:hypothetical protein